MAKIIERHGDAYLPHYQALQRELDAVRDRDQLMAEILRVAKSAEQSLG